MKNDNQSLEHIRHSLAHLLATATLEVFPDTLLTIGPAVEDGFYYDMDFQAPLTEKDLATIESKMKDTLKAWSNLPEGERGFRHKEVSLEEARALFANNPYKLELIEEIAKKGEAITLYTCGHTHATSKQPANPARHIPEFTDLCRGGHVEDFSTIDPGSFKLTRIAGAYWRGDEKNKMLTRVYGLAFATKNELVAHITQQEEAKKRDHRKLGKELKLFTISDLVGSGLPLFQPKGMILRKTLEDYLWELHKDLGYDRVWTPHLAKADLYMTSGHGMHYLADMFSVHGGTSKEDFYVKPMNCPHHMQLFADNQFSYRDMPVRYFEPATVYRDEKTGQLGGLTRVRAITQDDGHLFVRVSQLHAEVAAIAGIIKKFYTTMGMMDGYKVRLSVRDGSDNWLGSDEVWKTAEDALKAVCEAEQLPYFVGEGEAAFYGPKLDFMFKDAIGREWQLATIQCDFNQPERFDLSFINEKGEKERPVVIHRAISGSLERFLGVMIEHVAGAFPLWMSPVQVKVVPIGERQSEYANEVHKALKAAGIRVQTDDSNDSLGKKIRNAKTEKIPYALVLGDKEVESKTVTIESRNGNEGAVSVDALIERLSIEIKNRTL
ncbi:MAG TPA: threonine--tRNA ligase [Candidatus Paceibacterota bacterium]